MTKVCFIIVCYAVYPKGATVKLGPFDGRVAAILPSNHDYYISSPNYDLIFSPPGPTCNVYVRSDGCYGHDDHTQWPQPLSYKYLFICCIPKKSDANDNAIIWQDPDYRDFEWIIQDGVDIRLGKWSDWWLRSLEKSCKWLLDEVAQRRTNDKTLDAHPLVTPQSIYLERALNRVRAVPMGHWTATIGLRLVQRLWLELHALMDYVQIYLPAMDGRAPPATQVANIIGCFVQSAYDAERLFSAGIPYWLTRQIRTFTSEIIMSFDDVLASPEDLLRLDSPYNAHRIYQGDSNDNRFMAIRNHSLKYLRFADAFSDGNLRGINPFEFSQTASIAGPSKQVTHRSRAKSTQPCKIHDQT